jgi:hypothetical protein
VDGPDYRQLSALSAIDETPLFLYFSLNLERDIGSRMQVHLMRRLFCDELMYRDSQSSLFRDPTIRSFQLALKATSSAPRSVMHIKTSLHKYVNQLMSYSTVIDRQLTRVYIVYCSVTVVNLCDI